MAIDLILIIAAPVLIGLYVLYKTVALTSSRDKVAELEDDPYAFLHAPTLPETHRAPVWTPHVDHSDINRRAQEIINQNRATRPPSGGSNLIHHYSNNGGVRVLDGEYNLGERPEPESECPTSRTVTSAPLQENRRLELS